MSKIVISQPRYLPAINYLQRLYFADYFVILDVVQRQARGWENRNKLLLPNPEWLTIPIASSSRAILNETKVSGFEWLEAHKSKIHQYYKAAPFYKAEVLDALYDVQFLCGPDICFVDLMIGFIRNICALLDFEPNLIKASKVLGNKDIVLGPALLRIISESIDGVSHYVSGPNGKEYGVQNAFKDSDVSVLFHQFVHPKYSQGRDDFIPYMGCLDALFYCGQPWLSSVVRQKPVLEL